MSLQFIVNASVFWIPWPLTTAHHSVLSLSRSQPPSLRRLPVPKSSPRRSCDPPTRARELLLRHLIFRPTLLLERCFLSLGNEIDLVDVDAGTAGCNGLGDHLDIWVAGDDHDQAFFVEDTEPVGHKATATRFVLTDQVHTVSMSVAMLMLIWFAVAILCSILSLRCWKLA